MEVGDRSVDPVSNLLAWGKGTGIFPEGPADGNKENWALAWLSAASVCNGELYLSPLWGSMHVTGLLPRLGIPVGPAQYPRSHHPDVTVTYMYCTDLHPLLYF